MQGAAAAVINVGVRHELFRQGVGAAWPTLDAEPAVFGRLGVVVECEWHHASGDRTARLSFRAEGRYGEVDATVLVMYDTGALDVVQRQGVQAAWSLGLAAAVLHDGVGREVPVAAVRAAGERIGAG